jgi:hypothetical protein
LARLVIILLALLIGAAAPARAWCEASCLAAPSTTEHCPTRDAASGELSITAAAIDNCPVLEAARPATSGRIELKAAFVTIASPQIVARRMSIATITATPAATAVVQRHTPLRI